MSEKFSDGKILDHMKQMKTFFDNAKISYGGEMYMTEDQFRAISKILGKTEDETEEALKYIPELNLNELE